MILVLEIAAGVVIGGVALAFLYAQLLLWIEQRNINRLKGHPLMEALEPGFDAHQHEIAVTNRAHDLRSNWILLASAGAAIGFGLYLRQMVSPVAEWALGILTFLILAFIVERALGGALKNRLNRLEEGRQLELRGRNAVTASKPWFGGLRPDPTNQQRFHSDQH